MSNYLVTVTYKNHYNELDKKIEKLISKTIKDWKFDFLECSRILYFSFSSEKAANNVKKLLKKLPEDAKVSVTVEATK